jgi:photosystem II stability/assembly factor-like uncharacterized protein
MNGLRRHAKNLNSKCRAIFFFFIWGLGAGFCFAAVIPWNSVGPDGGDARSIAQSPGDPGHLYLGTTNSWIYESTDGARTWHRLARLSDETLIIDHIVIDRSDPAVLFAAAWTPGHVGGGLWVSHNGGRDWTESADLKGQSIRAFFAAPSVPSILLAGTLEGVYRSIDSGLHWSEISPPASREIHEVESLAVDPLNPDVIYAGTWHLPWKTSDGGRTWQSIKKGVIDDSDVFSIIIDPDQPRVVYASACSGIYKSESGGEVFRKIEGIPATARRTRVLRQDPTHHNVVYAGTTEGLYKTADGGKTFKRMTGPELIVNDVLIDPSNSEHVLVATDRGGVLASTDGAASFAAANSGFSERKVGALLVEGDHARRVFAGVVNDKAFGGVFVSDDLSRWKQVADGLEGRDVFVLAESPEGVVAAGTNSGVFVLEQGSSRWQSRNTLDHASRVPVAAVAKKNIRNARPATNRPLPELDGRVFALDLSGEAWVAATSGGVYTSRDKGLTWQGGPVMGVGGYLSVAARGRQMAAVRTGALVISEDAGLTWRPVPIPAALTLVRSVAFSPEGTLWLGGREGVYFSRDLGKTWMWVHRLPLVDVDDLVCDGASGSLLASSESSEFVYAIDVRTLAWRWWQTGYRLSAVRPGAGRLVAASLNNGVVVEPRGDEARSREQ